MSRSSTTRSIESGSLTGKSAAGRRPGVQRRRREVARLVGVGLDAERRRWRPSRQWYSGTNRLPSSKSKASRSACTTPVLAATPPMKATGGSIDLALGDRAAEVADDRVAQAAQHLGRLVALLLGVDHVALGEHAAAAGDAGRLAGAEHDVADVLDVVEQAAGLLVHERAGAGGAVAVGLVVDDARAPWLTAGLEADELGRLAAHLEHGLRVRVQGGDAAGDRLELVLEGGAERLA